MHKRNNKLAVKHFGKKKCLKFGLKHVQILTKYYANVQMVPEFWSRDSECSRVVGHQVKICTK